jgi:hypothetical protein
MMVLSTVGAWVLVKHRGKDIRIIKDLPSGFQTFDAWKLGMEDLSIYVSKHTRVDMYMAMERDKDIWP